MEAMAVSVLLRPVPLWVSALRRPLPLMHGSDSIPASERGCEMRVKRRRRDKETCRMQDLKGSHMARTCWTCEGGKRYKALTRSAEKKRYFHVRTLAAMLSLS